MSVDDVDDLEAAEDMVGALRVALEQVVEYAEAFPWTGLGDATGLMEKVTVALESARSYCRPTCEAQQCDDTCGCPGHEEGAEHWPGQGDAIERAFAAHEQRWHEIQAVERFERGPDPDDEPEASDGVTEDGVSAPPRLVYPTPEVIVHPVNRGMEWRAWCKTCGAHILQSFTKQVVEDAGDRHRCPPVEADAEFPPYPCPKDSDGQHFVGCGCDWL